MSSEYSEVSENVSIASLDDIRSGILSNKVRIIETSILDFITLLTSPEAAFQDEDEILNVIGHIIPRIKEPRLSLYSATSLMIATLAFENLATEICVASEAQFMENIENDHLVDVILLPFVLMNEIAGRDLKIREDIENILYDSDDEDMLLVAIKSLSIYFCFQENAAEWARKNLHIFNKIDELPETFAELKVATLYLACLCAGDDKGLCKQFCDIMDFSIENLGEYKTKKIYADDLRAIKFKLEENHDMVEKVKIDGRSEELNGVVNVILYKILLQETDDRFIGRSKLLRELLDLPEIKKREAKSSSLGMRKYKDNLRQKETKKKESKIRMSRDAKVERNGS